MAVDFLEGREVGPDRMAPQLGDPADTDRPVGELDPLQLDVGRGIGMTARVGCGRLATVEGEAPQGTPASPFQIAPIMVLMAASVEDWSSACEAQAWAKGATHWSG